MTGCFSDEPIGDMPMSKVGARKFYDALDEGKKAPAVKALHDKMTPEEKEAMSRLQETGGPDWFVEFHFWGGMAIRNFLREKGFGEAYWPIWNLDDIYVFLLEDAISKEVSPMTAL